MANSRFPKAKYVRMLRQLEDELAWWAASYAQAATTTDREWLEGRFMDRAAVLEHAVHSAHELADHLEGLPRLT